MPTLRHDRPAPPRHGLGPAFRTALSNVSAGRHPDGGTDDLIIPIRFLFLRPVTLTDRQVIGLFLHRYVLLLVACCVVPTLWFQLGREDGRPVLAAFVTLGQLILTAGVVLALLLLWGRFAARRPGAAVHTSPLILTGVLIATGTGIAASHIFGLDGLTDLRSAVVFVLLSTLMGELAAHFCTFFMLDRILADLDGGTPPVPHADAAPILPEPAPPRIVTVGQTDIPVDAIRSVSASGNRVQITLHSGREIVATTTFASVTDQLTPEDGIIISRSLWLSATTAPTPCRRAGELFLKIKDGPEFKVARPRRDAVAKWLAARG